MLWWLQPAAQPPFGPWCNHFIWRHLKKAGVTHSSSQTRRLSALPTATQRERHGPDGPFPDHRYLTWLGQEQKAGCSYFWVLSDQQLMVHVETFLCIHWAEVQSVSLSYIRGRRFAAWSWKGTAAYTMVWWSQTKPPPARQSCHSLPCLLPLVLTLRSSSFLAAWELTPYTCFFPLVNFNPN